jgi:hypothetical protein
MRIFSRRSSSLLRGACLGALLTLLPGSAVAPAAAQVAGPDEVRQIVTFSFLPGRSADGVRVFRDEALPLYEANPAMRSFRGFREVESPVPLDLVVVSSFEGMAGMDASNEALGALAADRGTSIGAIYGEISSMASGHTDQFAVMIPGIGRGDPASTPLTAVIWYQIDPAFAADFETALIRLAAYEVADEIPSATGRMLLSDGWDFVRFLGFESLEAYERYWTTITAARDYGILAGATRRRREAILSRIPELDVR